MLWKYLYKNLKKISTVLYKKLHAISHLSEALPTLFLLYFLLLILETLFPGFVSNTFNVNLLLIPIFILFIPASIIPRKIENQDFNLTPHFFIILISIQTGIIGLLILLRLIDLWFFGFILAILICSSILIISTMIVVSQNDDLYNKDFEKKIKSIKILIQTYFKKFLLKRINIPLPLVVFILGVIIFLILRLHINTK